MVSKCILGVFKHFSDNFFDVFKGFYSAFKVFVFVFLDVLKCF